MAPRDARPWDGLLRIAVHTAALTPMALLLWDYARDNLTANPIEDIQLRTGRYALMLLVLSLAAMPASRILGLRRIVPLRRTLGLYAFAYASLHLLNFLGLDYGFNLGLIREDLLEKWYALFGLAAFIILLPLAVTSTAGWQRRLGGAWAHMHRFVYLSAALAVTHFVLQTRGTITVPLVYISVVAALLVMRLPVLRRAAGRVRASLRHSP